MFVCVLFGYYSGVCCAFGFSNNSLYRGLQPEDVHSVGLAVT